MRLLNSPALNKIRKNLSIGNMTYEAMMHLNNTATNKQASESLALSTSVKYGMIPGSVKHSSKPSTAASSLMKHKINLSLSSANQYKPSDISNLKNSSTSKAKVSKIQMPSLKQFINSSYVNYKSIKEIDNKRKSEMSAARHSNQTNSSIYASRRSKNIADLNKSAEEKRKISNKLEESQTSSRHNNEASQLVSSIKNKKESSKILEIRPGYNPTNNMNFGLDEKYLESSLDRQDPNDRHSNNLWGEEKQEVFENLTSES